MPRTDAYDHGFGAEWNDVLVVSREGYRTSVTDYHEHAFYEVNLILSGDVKILLGDRSEEGTENRIVLTRPKTPHYISCSPDTLYSRLYLMFSEEFVKDYLPEWRELSAVFGKSGTSIVLTREQTAFFRSLIDGIRAEQKPFRKRLLVYHFLSHLSELSPENGNANRIPPYVVEALSYLEKHYMDKIRAEELSKILHVGRTTLMTEFKRYTDSTLGEYLAHCRLRHAVRLLSEGKTLEYTAERCGFSDSSGLCRSFRRWYGMSPKQYIEERTKSEA